MNNMNPPVPLFIADCPVTFEKKYKFQSGYCRYSTKVFRIVMLCLSVLYLILSFSASIKAMIQSVFFLIIVIFMPQITGAVCACIDVLSTGQYDRYEFYSNGIRNIDKRGDHFFQYQDIRCAYETEDFFYIQLRGPAFAVIEKAVIAGFSIEQARDFLYQSLGGRFTMVQKPERM